MAELIRLLGQTVSLRPYVFIFLLVYYVAATSHLGWRRAMVYIPVGYVVAWFSEYLSIHWGIPYGDYFYVNKTSGTELWVAGVPFMDSLSYVFLSYCAFATALFLRSPVKWFQNNIYVLETNTLRRSWKTLLLGSVLFVFLDIIIDPITLRGERWFLGRIYGYPEKGIYFGVPLSNFVGWFVVGLVMIKLIQVLDAIPLLATSKPSRLKKVKGIDLLGVLLFVSVVFFNLGITFWVGEYFLGLVGCFLFVLPFIFAVMITDYKNQYLFAPMLTDHLRDFPRSPAAIIRFSEGNKTLHRQD